MLRGASLTEAKARHDMIVGVIKVSTTPTLKPTLSFTNLLLSIV